MRPIRCTNVDPTNPAGRPDADDVLALGFTGERLVPRKDPVVRYYYREHTRAGAEIVLVITSDTMADYGADWRNPEQVRGAVWKVLSDYPSPTGVSLGNEPDGSEGASWLMTPAEYRTFHNAGADVVWNLGVTVCTAGFSSGQPDRIAEYLQGISYDVALIHAYAKNPEEARAMIRAFKAKLEPGKRWGCTEWHRGELDQIPRFVDMLEEEGAWLWAWFCHSDGMVAPMGMVGPNGGLKPLGRTLRDHLLSRRAPESVWTAPGLPVEPPAPPITPPAPPAPPVVPPPPPEVPAVATLDMLRQARWGAINPRIPFSPGLAICRYWLAHPGMGSALTQEVALDDGTVAQAFTCGILQWVGGDDVREVA